jgi:hypothetical protein
MKPNMGKNKIVVNGLGDRIAGVIKSVTGIEPCKACERRKRLLNELFPTKKAVEMEEAELRKFACVKDKTHLNNDELNFIESLYFKTFTNIKQYKLCRACPPVWITVIQQLTQVYDIQTQNQDEGTE